ncbi:zinc-ribbon domain-containing protein, partial [Paludifilum halophilum]
MTTPIKTQCPHCHAIFNIKKTQLNQKTANVCCEHCQHSFLVNNNLIVTNDT